MFDRTDPAYSAYIRILEAELIPATGCTEPIAIAYGAAKARQALGALPERCRVECSGNIIKNVKSVVVPNTGYLRGIEAAAAAGLVAGDPDVQLQVISHVAEKDREAIRAYRDSHPIEVVPYPGDKVFYIAVTVWAGADSARVVIEDFHTNITRIEKNGACLFALEGACGAEEAEEEPEYDLLSVERIIDFADHVDLFDVASTSRTTWTCSTWRWCWTGRSPTTPPSPRRGSPIAGAPASARPCSRPRGTACGSGPRRRPPRGLTPG